MRRINSPAETTMRVDWPWAAAVAVLVACIPLFAWQHAFFGDWQNHLAMVRYVGEHLKAHGTLPLAFHTEETIGRATPMFYGNFYLPAAGLLSAFIGARATLSVLIAGALVLQFVCVRALVWDRTRDQHAAAAVAVAVTWAIYPLTNAFNRGAMAEFIATTLLQAGLCVWLTFARDPSSPGAGRRARTAALLLTLAAGVHPPTALVGGITGGWFWLVSWRLSPDPRRVLRTSLRIAPFAAALLSPWIYLVVKMRSQLQISKVFASIWWFHSSLDAVATRLSPVPTAGRDSSRVTTPNLDAQINLGLLLAALVLLVWWLRRRRQHGTPRGPLFLAGAAAVATIFWFVASTVEPFWVLLPETLQSIQFAYRLVAHINIALLVLVVALLEVGGSNGKAPRIAIAVALAFAALGVAAKIPRCVLSASDDLVVKDLFKLPDDHFFYGGDDYATPDMFTPASRAHEPVKHAPVPIERTGGFGRVGRARIDVTQRTRLTTNVQAFAWNHLVVDGRSLPREEQLVDQLSLSTVVEPGTHEIGFELRPDLAWIFLRWCSGLAVVAWLASLGRWSDRLHWLRRARPAAVPGPGTP